MRVKPWWLPLLTLIELLLNENDLFQNSLYPAFNTLINNALTSEAKNSEVDRELAGRSIIDRPHNANS
jgi:hypothetical protein